MFWSHLHPIVVHFVVGLGCVALVRDILQLRAGKGGFPVSWETGILEGVVVLVLLGVGTGWIALVHDRILQHGGAPFPLGRIHGMTGVLFLGLATIRALGGPLPGNIRTRQVWIGLDLALLFTLLGIALLGEFLVFHEGLGLDDLSLQVP